MYTVINGLKIHYLVEGDGIRCVIPGLADTPIYERRFSANLRRHLKLVFVELRANRSASGSNIASATSVTINHRQNPDKRPRFVCRRSHRADFSSSMGPT